MTISAALGSSSFQFSDLNGDCLVSDVDIAIRFNRVLTERYGDNLQAITDLDNDGFVTAQDTLAAIRSIVGVGFGIIIDDGTPVSELDVQAEIIAVASGAPNADMNLDGFADVIDVIDTIVLVGADPSPRDISDISADIWGYVGQVRVHGEAYFAATECGDPDGHAIGISRHWPQDHPWYWPANHDSGVSALWQKKLPTPLPPEIHETHISARREYQNHNDAWSMKWKANHETEVSWTWGYPPNEYVPWYDENGPRHGEALSNKWPASHQFAASNSWTWNPADTHTEHVSSTWWPGHWQQSSIARQMPPSHEGGASNRWAHGQATSAALWPPNHSPQISGTWSHTHNIGLSASWPPGHDAEISGAWGGPRAWPANHLLVVSATWSEPPPTIPIFPPGHSWFATFEGIAPIPTPAWPFPWPRPPQ